MAVGSEKREIKKKIQFCIRAMEGTGELANLMSEAASIPDEVDPIIDNLCDEG